MAILAVSGLSGGWGATTIIENFNLALEPGEIVSIIGRNGVGKTTALELIIGRARRHAGTITLQGKSIEHLPIYGRCRAGLGYVPQGREVFPSLTVQENLAAAARPGAWTLDRVFGIFPSLRRRSGNLGRQLSGGEQQMLSIARALIGNPKVLLMDEPTEGLAPIVIEEVVSAIRALTRADALSVILVEQIVEVAFDLSDRCLVMDRGEVVHADLSANLAKDPTLVENLMGFS